MFQLPQGSSGDRLAVGLLSGRVVVRFSGSGDLINILSYEREDGVNECFLKEAYDSIHCDEYVYWGDQTYDDSTWYGQSGPGVCSMDYASYTNTKMSH